MKAKKWDMARNSQTFLQVDKNVVKESGQILPMAAFLLIPLLILAAFAVDLGSFYHRGSQLQSASDLASLTGAELQSQGASETEIRDAVNDVLESNGIDLGTVDADILLFADEDEVQVSLNDKDVPLYLSSFFVDEIEISRDAKAVKSVCAVDCEQPIAITPPLTGLPTISQGDGTVPLALTADNGKDYIFTLNHHVSSNEHSQRKGWSLIPQLICVDVVTKEFCPGYPKRINSSTADTSRLVHSVATNEIWFPIQRPRYATTVGDPLQVRQGARTYIGLGCVDLETLNTCGEHKFKDIVHGPPIGVGWDNDHRGMTSQLMEKDNKFYMIDNNMKIMCFDPVARANCAGYPVSRPAVWNPVANKDLVGNKPGTDSGPDIFNWAPDEGYEPVTVIGDDRLYAYWPAKNGVYVVCFDIGSKSPCSGFGAPLVHNGPWYWGPAIFENLDSSGNHNGVCIYAKHPLKCVDKNGATIVRNDLNSSLAPQDYRTYSFPFRMGNKLFVSAPSERDRTITTSYAKTYCVDLVSGASCGDRQDPQPYGYDQMPGRECIISVGHLGKFSSFSPEDLQPCRTGNGLIEIFPCSCDGEDFFWGELSFGGEFLANFDSFAVTIKDNTGEVLIEETDLLDSNGRLDLSSLDPTLTSVFVEYESEVDTSIIWTEAIEGSFSVSERATLTK